MKLTKKQIDMIRQYTPVELKGQQIGSGANTLGYYMPANANWSYQAKFIDHNGAIILVVTRFGEIM